MRRILALIAAALLALPASAQTMDIAGVRAYFDAGDYAGLDDRLARMHRQSLDGTISYDEVRQPYVAFSVGDPRMKAFIEEWRAAYPYSPYARVAMAWLLWHEGWLVRGDRLAAYVLPEAFDRMHQAHDEAVELAWSAYLTAPDLLPASDALLRLSTTANLPASVEDVVAAVMQVAPSRGTLWRAAPALAPRWGGSLEQILALCERHAAQVTDVEDYGTDICAADLILGAGIWGPPREAAFRVLSETQHPRLLYGYAQTPLRQESLEGPGRDYVLSLIEPEDSTAWRLANDYYQRSFNAKAERLRDRVLANARQWARREIAYDPYDPELIRLITGAVIETGGTLAERRAVLDRFYQPYLRRFPTDADAWMALGDPATTFGEDPDIDRRDGYMQTALAVSRHYPPMLLQYHEFKYNLYVNQVKLYRQRGEPPPMDQAEIDRLLTCPMIRTVRLISAACGPDGRAGSVCTGYWMSSPETRLEVLHDAADRKACARERMLPAFMLQFQPVPPDWPETPTETPGPEAMR